MRHPHGMNPNERTIHMATDETTNETSLETTTPITMERLAELLRAEVTLNRLECAGVTSWDGFEYALEDGYDTQVAAINAKALDGTLTP